MKSSFSKILALAALVTVNAQNVVLTNDDGWATAQIRAEYDALRQAGYKVILSAPAIDRSGTGSSTATPQPLSQACEFNTCPAGSPAIGTDANDSNVHYVNAFPVDAVRTGIRTFAPQVFGGPPAFVVSGSNVGNNLSNLGGSGTIGAACEATLEGIPAFAFSGATASLVSYTTLTSQPDSTSSVAAHLYTDLIIKFLSTYLGAGSSGPIIPRGISVNVNFGPVTSSCRGSANGFKFVATRLLRSTAGTDTSLCGTTNLPAEATVAGSACFVSVSVFNATTKLDVAAASQKSVFDKLAPILTCF